MPALDEGLRSRIIREIWKTLDALARRDDAALHDVFARSRVELSDVYRTMEEYGSDFGSPPANAYDDIEVGQVTLPPLEYFTEAYFWGADGAPSDLSAILSITFRGEAVLIEIDGVRVM